MTMAKSRGRGLTEKDLSSSRCEAVLSNSNDGVTNLGARMAINQFTAFYPSRPFWAGSMAPLQPRLAVTVGAIYAIR